MNRAFPLGYYESLIVQTEIDFNKLKKTFEMFKNNTSYKKLILELYQNYSFLLQDIKYIEKFNKNISELELQVSVRFMKILSEAKIFLREIKKESL